MTGRLHVVFGVLSACVVMLAIGLGFSLVGSPMTRRAERFDEERLRDLQVIVREVHNLVIEPGPPPTLRRPLPKTLDEIAEKARLEKIVTHDPETGEAYRYVVKDGTTFELCARFTYARNSTDSVYWNHPAGQHCYTVKVLDPPPFY